MNSVLIPSNTVFVVELHLRLWL